MDNYQRFMGIFENAFSVSDPILFNNDNDIISFIESIFRFEEQQHFLSGSDLITSMNAIEVYDSGFAFKERGIYFLLYR